MKTFQKLNIGVAQDIFIQTGKKNNPGNALKNAFWRAAKASTIAEFNICIDEVMSISPFAYDDLLRTNPKDYLLHLICHVVHT